MAAEPPKAPERPENSAPFRCGSGVIGALRPLDGEITCTATPQLRSSWVRVRIVRSWRLLPARGTCDATSVCKTAFPRTKQAGVASPQPLTLTLVTPVCAPLVHLVRAIERRAPLRGRNPRRAQMSPGRIQGPALLASDSDHTEGRRRLARHPCDPVRRSPHQQHRTRLARPKAPFEAPRACR